jgi:hypothetical protein
LEKGREKQNLTTAFAILSSKYKKLNETSETVEIGICLYESKRGQILDPYGILFSPRN